MAPQKWLNNFMQPPILRCTKRYDPHPICNSPPPSNKWPVPYNHAVDLLLKRFGSKQVIISKQLEMKVKNDHRSKFSNLSNWKEEAWKKKKKGFNRIGTRDLRVAGALLYQLSYEATHWERGQFIEFISPVRSEMMWSIWNNSFLNCGCTWKWRMIIAVNFPI